jgi:hypothetical protein
VSEFVEKMKIKLGAWRHSIFQMWKGQHFTEAAGVRDAERKAQDLFLVQDTNQCNS